MSDRAFRASTASILNSGPQDLYERMVANSWDPERALRAYTPLHRDEQIRFDLAVLRTFEERLRVTRRLMSLGLVETIDNPFRVSELEYEKEDAPGGGVVRSMSPIPRTDSEKPDYTQEKVPVYFTSAMFQLDLRSLETSRNRGTPLDTTIAVRKARSIVEDIEDAVINGSTPTISGNQAKGLLDAPSIQTLLCEGSWDDPAKTGAQILDNVLDAIGLAEDKSVFGPFDLVVTTKWWTALQDEFSTSYPRTILSRLREIEAGGDALHVYVADKVPVDTAILYPRNIDNVRVLVGNMGGSRAPENDDPENAITPISLFPWDTHGGFIKNWLVAACVVPNMRDTSASQSGIVKIVPGS